MAVVSAATGRMARTDPVFSLEFESKAPAEMKGAENGGAAIASGDFEEKTGSSAAGSKD